MSFIGHNIKKIRQLKKISQAEFATLFNLARPSIGAYEEGRSEPKIDTLIAISKQFNLSIDVLLLKELTSVDLMNLESFSSKMDRAHRGSQFAERRPTLLVARDQQETYLRNWKDKKFLLGLKAIQVPYSSDEELRAFELPDDRLYNQGRGLAPGDILIAKLTKKPKPDLVQVLVTNNLLVFGRLHRTGTSSLFIKPDNPYFEVQKVKKEEINEIWETVAYFSTRVPMVQSMDRRIVELENKLSELHNKFSDK